MKIIQYSEEWGPCECNTEYQTNLRTGTENYVSLLFLFFLLSLPLILSFSKFEVLRISPTSLHILSKHCNTELYPQAQYFLYCLNFHFIKLNISIISSHIFPTNWISTFQFTSRDTVCDLGFGLLLRLTHKNYASGY